MLAYATSDALNRAWAMPGDFEAEWAVPAEVGFGSLTSSAAAVVHPKGWNDWFPLWFRMPVRKTSELNARNTTFSDGRNVFDREGVSVQHEANPTDTPYDRLASHAFQVSYNNQGSHPLPYNPQDIHARFPASGGMITTGVGRIRSTNRVGVEARNGLSRRVA
jgi:hypothetical protein